MGRNTPIKQLDRYEELLGVLKSGDPITTGELASKLGVTRRTIDRDINALRMKGYPIEADRGRGGGVRLYRNWAIAKVTLNYREVLDLLISIAVLEKLQSPLFLNNLQSIRNKIHHTFPDSQKQIIHKLRKRILISNTASSSMMSSYNEPQLGELSELIIDGFLNLRPIKIEYIDGLNNITERVVEVHYLFLSWPIWYLIGYDHLRAAPRTFRIDRVAKVGVLNAKFNLKKIADFSDMIEQISVNL